MNFSLPQLLSEERSLGVFLLVTIAIGGGAAWLTGRAIAGTWRPWWQAIAYAVILGAVVRFFHFALFEGTLLLPRYYLVDTVVCLIAALLGYRTTRLRQMSTQYRWLKISGAQSARQIPPAAPVSQRRNSG
jgi:small-conductance mechanosensitive channel